MSFHHRATDDRALARALLNISEMAVRAQNLAVRGQRAALTNHLANLDLTVRQAIALTEATGPAPDRTIHLDRLPVPAGRVPAGHRARP